MDKFIILQYIITFGVILIALHLASISLENVELELMDKFIILQYIITFGVILIALHLASISLENVELDTTSSRPSVFIAIVSSRNHFSSRNSIRKSWIQDIKKYDGIRYKFFVGKKCPIHPLDRIDKYTCTEINVTDVGNTENKPQDDSMLKLDNLICRSVSQGVATLHDAKTCYSGFGFTVFHNLFLTSIGVRFEYFQELENFEIIFRDAEEVFEKIHVFKNDCLNTLNGFCFINLKEKFLLPKDFEGSVLMSHSKEISLNSTKEFCEWNSDGNFFLTFGIIGNLYERYREGRCSNLIANFSLQDPDAVKDHNNLKAKRNSEWMEEENIIDNDLYKEMKTNDDLVYLHNVIDVYRNLPSKILEVIKWSNGNYPSSYLLKVDDDTNLNIHFLMDWMTQEIKAPRSLTLHSNFHYHREVPMFGKWADFDFQGLTYPPFPSGAGYLLSDRLVYLLSMQAPFMRHFQGEDVSMGIWTQVLRLGQDIVEKKHVSCWLPSASCNQSIIIPEIIPNPVISIER